MIPLVTTIFFASLLGSLHCVGMCGAFMAIVTGDESRWRDQLAYHGGRLLTYVGLGALAGLVGHGLNVSSTIAGLGPIAAILSATMVIGFSIMLWLRLKGYALPHVRGPKFIHRFASAGYRIAMRQAPARRAFIVGLLTTLLPCGWLWTFLLTAAGSAHPASAAVVMLVFWAGTLPAMTTLGVGLRGVFGAAQRHLPTLTCAAMLVIGLTTIFGRSRLDPTAWAGTPTTQPSAVPPCCEIDHADAH